MEQKINFSILFFSNLVLIFFFLVFRQALNYKNPILNTCEKLQKSSLSDIHCKLTYFIVFNSIANFLIITYYLVKALRDSKVVDFNQNLVNEAKTDKESNSSAMSDENIKLILMNHKDSIVGINKRLGLSNPFKLSLSEFIVKIIQDVIFMRILRFFDLLIVILLYRILYYLVKMYQSFRQTEYFKSPAAQVIIVD